MQLTSCGYFNRRFEPPGVRSDHNPVCRRCWQTGDNERISFASVHENSNVHGSVNTAPIMNIRVLSGSALEKALAAKLEELLRGVDWLRGWQVEHVGGTSDAGFDLLATDHRLPVERKAEA